MTPVIAADISLGKLRVQTMNNCESTGNASASNSGWCYVCNVSLTAETANEHYESRTHLNRCLQKGIGISIVPTSESSSSWCSICNLDLESASAAEQHYEGRAHMNKCLQRGIGIPVSYGTSPAITPPADPHFMQSGAPTSPQGGAAGYSPSAGFTSFRPGSQRTARPHMTFQQGNRQMGFGGKNFPAQSNLQMSGPYGGGYGQEMQSPDAFRQYDDGWQSQSSANSGWPYCETCDQRFQTFGALSQHYNTSSHMEMKAMKQNQFHGFPAQGAVEQSRFYQNSSSHGQGQTLNQGSYFNNQVSKQHEAFRNPGQNQGTHYVPKEWRPFNQTVQYHN